MKKTTKLLAMATLAIALPLSACAIVSVPSITPTSSETPLVDNTHDKILHAVDTFLLNDELKVLIDAKNMKYREHYYSKMGEISKGNDFGEFNISTLKAAVNVKGLTKAEDMKGLQASLEVLDLSGNANVSLYNQIDGDVIFTLPLSGGMGNIYLKDSNAYIDFSNMNLRKFVLDYINKMNNSNSTMEEMTEAIPNKFYFADYVNSNNELNKPLINSFIGPSEEIHNGVKQLLEINDNMDNPIVKYVTEEGKLKLDINLNYTNLAEAIKIADGNYSEDKPLNDYIKLVKSKVKIEKANATIWLNSACELDKIYTDFNFTLINSYESHGQENAEPIINFAETQFMANATLNYSSKEVNVNYPSDLNQYKEMQSQRV